MKRSALKVDPDRVLAWKRRTAKALRPRSRKQIAVYRERRPFVAEFLAAHPRCEFSHRDARHPEPLFCIAASEDVHEVIRRSHGGARYPGEPGRRATRYLALCREHHDFISTHPGFARANGFEER